MAKDDAEFEEFRNSLGLYISDPWERVKFIFMKNDYGEPHPDFLQATDRAQLGFLMGFGIGGVIRQRKYLQDLKERSDTNVYHSRYNAYRELSRESLKGFLKGGFLWGTRLGFFCGCFSLFASCVEAYRHKAGVIENTIAGSVLGAFLRFHYGIRGTLVGGLLGSVLGTIYGVVNVGMIKLVHGDVVLLKYGQYSFSKQLNLSSKVIKAEKQGKEIQLPPSHSDIQINPLSVLSDEEKSVNKKTES